MNKIYIGQNSSGKTTNIKKHIDDIADNVLILDFNNEYDEFTDAILYVDDINPLLSKLNLTDVQALNAGYDKYTHCLWKKAEEVIRYTSQEDMGGDLTSVYRMNLLEDALDRLHFSWDASENSHGKMFNRKIPSKKQKRQMTLESALEVIKTNKRVLLKSRNIHSDIRRAVTFVLLSRMSRNSAKPFYIVGDDQATVFNDGNLKLFSKTIDSNNLRFILSYNKTANIPTNLIPTFDTYYIHRFEKSGEIKQLKNLINLTKNIKNLSNGEFVTVNLVRD